MTLEELKKCDKAFVNSADIAKIVGCDPYALTLMAREQPEKLEKLGLRPLVIGKRVRFPRVAFIRYVEGMEQE